MRTSPVFLCKKMRKSSLVRLYVAMGAALLTFSCSALLVPHPPGGSPPGVVGSPPLTDTLCAPGLPEHPLPGPVEERPRARGQGDAEPFDSLDFSLAFDDDAPEEFPFVTAHDKVAELVGVQKTVPVVSDWVRIAVRQDRRQQVIYNAGSYEVRAAGGKTPRMRGRVLCHPRGSRLLCANGPSQHFVNYPCTLAALDGYSFFEVDSVAYRGWIIIDRGTIPDRILVVNYLPVEEYLRGVVPLEIGARGAEEIEALKAQAVAARTYTYRKMLSRTAQRFDLLPTVADQVYGGSGVEARTCDQAITATQNVVMLWDDSLITAYYHSTCGGTTANVAQVWNKPPQPYLITRSDTDSSGHAYCRQSRYYNWTYRWTTPSLSAVLGRYGAAASAEGLFGGRVNALRVAQRHPCGRVARLEVRSGRGTLICVGDQTRFALRRDSAGHPILPSSRFKVERCDSKVVELSGSGYGHGVGMCQMGALGRSRAAQSWRQILQAYYTGVAFAQVATTGK